MIILRSDNRVLTNNSEYSYLVDNVPSGAGTITIINTENFAVGDFIVIEEFGKENAEMFRINALNTTTGLVTLANATNTPVNTKFSHSESTKVYYLPYNQIRFFWTAATGTIADENPTFDMVNPLTGWVDIDPANWFTAYSDAAHSTGFGWFVYQNSVSLEASQESNPIPYAGFEGNTVQNVFEGFNSLLNTKELGLVSNEERFEWLNEALALVRNKLNLNSIEYFVSTPQTLNVIAGTQEYQLPNDFADLVSITGGESLYKEKLPYISINKVGSFNESGYTTYPHYYIRNRYIGFVPIPEANATYQYQYRKNSTRVTSLSEYIDLPDNAYYALKDFMMYRASMKFQNPIAKAYNDSFVAAINLYVQSAVKRDADLDSWEPGPQSMI